MTRNVSMALVALTLLLTIDSPTIAMNDTQNGLATGLVHHSVRHGENIHNATVDGHQFAYYVIDMKKPHAEMKDMQTTHHMMVYLTGPDGKQLNKAKVGYLVVAPDGAKQKLMGMDMQGSFGADVNFGQKGTYSIKSKAVVDGKTLIDQFTYDVK